MSGKPGQASEKPSDVPSTFAPGFLHGLDGRRAIPRAVTETMTQLSDAIGGDPSPQAAMLIEHGVWAHMRLRQLQARFVETGELDHKQYSALLNALTGTLRSIGLERRAKPAEDLHAYMRRKAAEESGGQSAA